MLSDSCGAQWKHSGAAERITVLLMLPYDDDDDYEPRSS